MTWYLPQSGQTVTLANGDDVFIAPQVFINQPILAPGTGHEIVVAGTLSASGNIPISFSSTSGGSLRVESTGQVRGFDGLAVYLYGGGQEVINHGLIRNEPKETADRGILINSLSNAVTTRIVNTGTIVGDDVGISSNSSVTAAVATVILENSGTIEARGFGGQFAHRSYMNEGGAVRDQITNTGLMIGDIELEAGNDFYDGRLGTVQGRVLGGEGDDEIYTGAGNDDISGGSGDDILHGGAGNDTLRGGLDVDEMRGGTGNDTYFVDNAGDRAIEASKQGTDLVNSSVTFSLGGQHIEKLTLSGAAKINGTGNSLNNGIVGNSAANVIDGKTGADRMEGGAGGDRYYVDNAGDKVIEANVSGDDRVVSTVSFSLAGQYIERLTLDGAGNINGTGNSLANGIAGNSGSNVLNGRTGNDTLTGGGAADFFVFSDALNAATNVDTITDFQINLDKIRLDNAIFAQVGTGLTASEFIANTSGTATTNAHNILYDTTDGRLFYDPDGTGAQARVHFATLKAGLALDHLDFAVI